MKKIESFVSTFREADEFWDFYKFEVYEDSIMYNDLINYIDVRGLNYEICRYSNGWVTVIFRTYVNTDRFEIFKNFSHIRGIEFEGNVTTKQSNLFRIFKRVESF